jgi:hypothetical protein
VLSFRRNLFFSPLITLSGWLLSEVGKALALFGSITRFNFVSIVSGIIDLVGKRNNNVIS